MVVFFVFFAKKVVVIPLRVPCPRGLWGGEIMSREGCAPEKNIGNNQFVVIKTFKRTSNLIKMSISEEHMPFLWPAMTVDPCKKKNSSKG